MTCVSKTLPLGKKGIMEYITLLAKNARSVVFFTIILFHTEIAVIPSVKRLRGTGAAIVGIVCTFEFWKTVLAVVFYFDLIT